MLRKTLTIVVLALFTLVVQAQEQHSGWVFIQDPDTAKYHIGTDVVRLYGSVSSLTKNERPTFMGHRQEASNLLMSAHVDFRESYSGDEAGLCVYHTNDSHAEICLEGTREKMLVSFRATQKELSARFAQIETSGYEIWLRIRSDGKLYLFDYSTDGSDYKTLFKISCSLLNMETVDGTSEVLCGMYCTKRNATDLTYANFFDFRFENW